MNRTELALQAAKAALRVRQRLQISPIHPVSVFDLARKLELEAWFVDIPSLEGMYVQGTPATIFVGSHRPCGRQAMTCAHEIGHHVFRHGSHVDEYLVSDKAESRTPEEYLANTFAANLLMTKGAVAQGLLARGISVSESTPEQLYQLAGWLGVSYSGLIYHMRSAQHLIPRHIADRLLKAEPKDIRAELAARLHIDAPGGEILVADSAWVGRPIDGQVGDIVALPNGTSFDDFCGTLDGKVLTLTRPGIGRVYNRDARWSAFVRVSRRSFAGLSDYRHLEEVEEEASEAENNGVATSGLARHKSDSYQSTDAV